MSSLAGVVASYAINSLWQVPLVAGAGWVVSRSLTKVGARAQHRIWVLTLWCAVVVPAMPLLLHGSSLLHGAGHGRGGASILFAGADGGVVRANGITVLPAVLVWALLIAYLGVLLCFVVRLCRSIYWTAALVREARSLELGPEIEDVWSRCQRAFGLSDVRLLSSAQVDGPVTMGWRRAALLLPRGFAERCEPHELLAALAHECAHIERRDFQKNLMYEVASLLIAFHPVTRMMKAQIAQTREMICDEIAVESVMDPRTYAKSLLRLAAMISVVSRAVPNNAIGVFDANILEKRIMTIKAKRQAVSARYGLIIPAALLLFSGVVGGAAARGTVVQSRETDSSKQYAQVYSVGKDVSAPKLVSSVQPEFPASARKGKDKFEGTAVVGFVVDTSGMPRDVKVVRSLSEDFDAEAIKAVQQYRFSPAMRAGEPVAVALRVEVAFRKF